MEVTFPETYGWLKQNWELSPSDSKTYILFSHTTFHFPKNCIKVGRGQPVLTSENEQNWACKELTNRSAGILGTVGQSTIGSHWVALTRSILLLARNQSPLNPEVKFQPVNPRGIMYHENMAWELEPKEKKKPVIEMRIIAVEGGMWLETGCPWVGEKWTRWRI